MRLGIMRRPLGVVVATITTSNGSATSLPNWFLACAVAAFFTATIAIVGTAITTYTQVQQTAQRSQDNTTRIEKLEALQIDVAAMKADISSIKDGQRSTNDKLDRLVDRELNGRGR